jgi:hypothetical protein
MSKDISGKWHRDIHSKDDVAKSGSDRTLGLRWHLNHGKVVCEVKNDATSANANTQYSSVNSRHMIFTNRMYRSGDKVVNTTTFSHVQACGVCDNLNPLWKLRIG